MPIDNLARSDVVTASTDDSVHELAGMMHDEDVGSIVITDDGPVGIVTDRDLTMQVLAEQADPDELVAEDVMSDGLQTIEHDAGFYEATELMSEHSIRRLPVTDADGSLEGIITADDLNELLAEEQQGLAEVIRAQRPPY
ncbi:CBS domain-containing protein [Haloterrigena sp. H1]|uniref:CBS domain-containing protein n=1 Tax=Haloterrigena sp. H1 TaxID=2552943 RepID=UPI00110E3246|nr:CBS domain-containing protein [Haloterrigena sp. H1]TMT86548.1 CBS domain-containing protein [Haloterrigena sp. H1]